MNDALHSQRLAISTKYQRIIGGAAAKHESTIPPRLYRTLEAHASLTMATPESRKKCSALSWMASADRLIAERSFSWDRKGKLAAFRGRIDGKRANGGLKLNTKNYEVVASDASYLSHNNVVVWSCDRIVLPRQCLLQTAMHAFMSDFEKLQVGVYDVCGRGFYSEVQLNTPESAGRQSNTPAYPHNISLSRNNLSV